MAKAIFMGVQRSVEGDITAPSSSRSSFHQKQPDQSPARQQRQKHKHQEMIEISHLVRRGCIQHPLIYANHHHGFDLIFILMLHTHMHLDNHSLLLFVIWKRACIWSISQYIYMNFVYFFIMFPRNVAFETGLHCLPLSMATTTTTTSMPFFIFTCAGEAQAGGALCYSESEL
jgi:hypothetical protein